MKELNKNVSIGKEERYLLVGEFDETDWEELFLTEYWEPRESGKDFLRVN